MKICSQCKLQYPDRAQSCFIDGSPLSIRVPELFGRYRSDRWIGDGRLGEVHEATREDSTLRFAIKVMHASIADAAAKEAFRRGGYEGHKLAHANIVEVFEVGDDPRGRPFIAMEWLEGPTLRALLDSGELDQARAIRILMKTAGAVAAAHDRGVCHGDLKPENVFLLADGRVKVSDFAFGSVLRPRDLNLRVVNVSGGSVFGTPYYPIAPKRSEPQAEDAYALGVLIFELIARQLPFFDAPDGLQRAIRQQRDPPPRLSSLVPNVPSALDRLALALMGPSDSDRPTLRDAFLDLVAIRASLGYPLIG